jgi:hypothetical protein
MFKRIAFAFTGLVATALIAIGATLPLMPSTSQFSEPSQIVGTINALIQTLNGQAGYTTAQPIVALGSLCQSAASASPNTCNGQRGAASFTGITVAAPNTNQTLTITNSAVNASSICQANFTTAFTAATTINVGQIVPTAGSLAVSIGNSGSGTNGVTTGTLGFNCVN